MLAEPCFKADGQPRFGRPHRPNHGPAHAYFFEVPTEEPCAVDGVMVAAASLGARTSARSQMLFERRQIDGARACIALCHDVADMSCRPQIAHGRVGAIALPFERCG